MKDTFRALAVTIVPEARNLDAAGWRELEGIVEQALAERPSMVRRQLGLLVRLIEALSFLRYGRRFASLDPIRRTRLLGWLQDFPVVLARRGFWGLRTLVLMGYYGRPPAAAEIGYQADVRGWEARR